MISRKDLYVKKKSEKKYEKKCNFLIKLKFLDIFSGIHAEIVNFSCEFLNLPVSRSSATAKMSAAAMKTAAKAAHAAAKAS